ncbi:hypothetical protein D3C71_1915780 [compost metagenome]
MHLQSFSVLTAKQIPVGCLRADEFVERREHHQPLRIGMIAIARWGAIETQLAIAVVLEQPYAPLGKPTADLLLVCSRHQPALGHVGGR